MGFFGDDSSSNMENDELNRQMNASRQEVAMKRKNLYDQQLNMLKSQGGQNWTSDRNKPGY